MQADCRRKDQNIRMRAAVIAKITRLAACAEMIADGRMNGVYVSYPGPLWAEDVRTVRQLYGYSPYLWMDLPRDLKVMLVLFAIEWLRTEGDVGP